MQEEHLDKESLEQYFKKVNELGPDEYTLYRGQSQESYGPEDSKNEQPLPSLLRKVQKTPTNFLVTMKDSYLQEELGLNEHNLPDWAKLDDYNYINLEDSILSYFDELSMKIGHRIHDNKLDKLVTAQHCGVPTRLLDWTTNPLKALFFAVDKVKYHGNTGKDGVVYVFKYNRKKIYDRQYIKNVLQASEDLKQINPLYPEPSHPRVIAQESCFTIFPLHGTHTIQKEEGKEETCIEKIATIRIPSDYKSKLREALRLLGINYFSLSPDLDGIGTEINRFFERF